MAEESSANRPRFKRALIKLSGEAFMGRLDYGIDPEMVKTIADELAAYVEQRGLPNVAELTGQLQLP